MDVRHISKRLDIRYPKLEVVEVDLANITTYAKSEEEIELLLELVDKNA